MSICSAERRDVTLIGLSVVWKMSGKCLANAGTVSQTSQPQPADNPPKKPEKNRQNFSVRDQAFGIYSQLCQLFTIGTRCGSFLGRTRLVRCYRGRVAQLKEQVTLNQWVTGSSQIIF